MFVVFFSLSFFLNISFGGNLRTSKACIEHLWMAPLMPAMMVMSGLVFHLLVFSVWMFGLYLLEF